MPRLFREVDTETGKEPDLESLLVFAPADITWQLIDPERLSLSRNPLLKWTSAAQHMPLT
jgi:hypothetical protein